MRARLTLDDAKDLDFKDLLERGYDILAEYEAPDMETPQMLETRISKTLDELPDVYAWFLQLHAWFDHWSDFYYRQDKTGLEYKGFRQRRDALEKLAGAAKLRYEGTSRRLTQILGSQEETRMPRTRG